MSITSQPSTSTIRPRSASRSPSPRSPKRTKTSAAGPSSGPSSISPTAAINSIGVAAQAMAQMEAEAVQSPERKHAPLTKADFFGGLFLAPMVRSGCLPTRLFALKHGASLVWGPEIVDKAILHSERVVDPVSGTVLFMGNSAPIFTCHPIEKPFLIYQIGTADPALAVSAARRVMNDVSGIDLNCGCPKPFSTTGGMGAALLTNPDLLCQILTELRVAMPPHITVSAKIRLLPDQADTLKLVERIVNTGISVLTVHCRTRAMREKDPAVLGRLREIVDFVHGMGKGIAVVENGDCLGMNDVQRVKDTTGADSVMIARAAESNPSAFSPTPLVDIEETLVPAYLRLAKHVKNHFSLTKFCATGFKSPSKKYHKSHQVDIRTTVVKAKSWDDAKLKAIMGEPESSDLIHEDGTVQAVGGRTGADELEDIRQVLEARPLRVSVPDPQLVPSSMIVQENERPSTPTSSPCMTCDAWLNPGNAVAVM